MDERAVGAAGDIPKLSSQVGRVTRSPESQNQVSSFGLGHGVLRVRVRLARRQTRLETRQRRVARIQPLRDRQGVGEALRGLVGRMSRCCSSASYIQGVMRPS